jgi:hypothetical protein
MSDSWEEEIKKEVVRVHGGLSRTEDGTEIGVK